MNVAEVVIFEDAQWRDLYPITLSRPAFDCRAGGSALGRRLAAQLAHRGVRSVSFLCRPALRPQVERDHPAHEVNRAPSGDALFLNGRLLCLGNSLAEVIDVTERTAAVHVHDTVIAARQPAAAAPAYWRELEAALAAGDPTPFPRGQTRVGPPEGVRLTTRLWDLVTWLPETIEDDYAWARERLAAEPIQLASGAQILNKEHILARERVQVEPGAILDARSGPILLGEDVRIEHNAVVLGPAYLGPNTRVRMGAKLYDGISCGPYCKLGGEVEAAILQGYANKQHDGFLGHAYLGAWTNLGAATNNSDLKNNYGTVRVPGMDGEVDTGLLFAGLYMADHAKTAIGTLLNTGTVIGFSANVFGAGFPPRHVPSFAWGGFDADSRYDVDKAIETARRVMARRGITLEPADEVVFRRIHEHGAA